MRTWIGPAVGTVIGLSAAVADAQAGGLVDHERILAIGMILNAGFVWAGIGVLAGLATRRRLYAVTLAVASLVLAVVAYYGYAVTFGDRAELGVAAVSGKIVYWSVAAIVLGPVLGLIGWRAGGTGWPAMLARAVIPVGAIVEMVWWQGISLGNVLTDPWRVGAQMLVVGCAFLGLALVLLGGPGGQRSPTVPTSPGTTPETELSTPPFVGSGVRPG